MELKKATHADFEKIYSAMEKSFIKEERRDYRDAKAILYKDEYSIYNIYDGELFVGFITLWELSDFTFAEHFVIFDEYRNRGYGSAALGLIKEKFTRVVLEVEPPIEEMQKRRFAFYKRAGFIENPEPYVQPSYREGGDGVALIIMSYPATLSDFSGSTEEIYLKVYNKKFNII